MPIRLHRVSAAMRAAGRLSALLGLFTLLGGSLPGPERPFLGVDLAWETLPAQDEEGRPLGTLVWSALTDPATAGPARPVMVVFNGGPGAASGWLQLGLLGPLQVSLPPPSGADTPASPLRVAERTLAEQADMLFVDPLDTGFSRRDPAVSPDRVRSGAADGAYLARAVAAWLVRHGRQSSPVIVLGESFGAERAVAVAEAWQREMPWVRLAGIAMISQTVLNETDLRGTDRVQALAMGLPTLAATACYHRLATVGPRPAGLRGCCRAACRGCLPARVAPWRGARRHSGAPGALDGAEAGRDPQRFTCRGSPAVSPVPVPGPRPGAGPLR
jgi:hypothetical protein